MLLTNLVDISCFAKQDYRDITNSNLFIFFCNEIYMFMKTEIVVNSLTYTGSLYYAGFCSSVQLMVYIL